MRTFSSSQIEELDELTYKRFRSESSHSHHSYSQSDAQRLRTLISELWKIPKARPGDLVAGVVLEEVVGKGAFGTVWKGRTLAEDEPRAVKVFDTDRLGDGLAVHLFRRGVRSLLYLQEQFERELQSGATEGLSDYVVTIFEVEPHLLAFSMEWIPGGELSEAQVKKLSLQDKISLFLHVVRAVGYLHTRPNKLVHRDIKPQNILMREGRPIITDFDNVDMSLGKTLSSRAVGGSLAYAAPEQLSGKSAALEVRSDIYSLGRLLHFLLIVEEPPALHEANPSLEDLNDFPEGLVKIIRRCTQRDPELRYPDVGALVSDLLRYEQCEKVGAFGPNYTLGQRHWKRAETLAGQRAWESALVEARQALAYMHGLDTSLVERWTLRILTWRLRSGERGLFWTWLTVRMQQLSFWGVVFLFCLLLVPIGVSLIRYERSRARNDKFEVALQTLVKVSSLKSKQARSSIAMLQSGSSSLFWTRRRVLRLLSHSTGREACRYFKLLYVFAPRSQEFLYLSSSLSGKQSESLHQRRVSSMLDELAQYRWGPVDCAPGTRLPWMHLTSRTTSKRNVKWKLQRADLRFLHAERLHFSRADMKGSNLTQAKLRGTVLNDSNLSGGRLVLADLRKAHLVRSNIMGASLTMANLHGANLRQVFASYADFRLSRLGGASFHYGTFTGALFSADSLPDLRAGKLHPTSFRRAICMTGGPFLLPGVVDQCFQWHRETHMKQNFNSRPRPAGCPPSLRQHTIFLAYPPGTLKKEGQCPSPLAP